MAVLCVLTFSLGKLSVVAGQKAEITLSGVDLPVLAAEAPEPEQPKTQAPTPTQTHAEEMRKIPPPAASIDVKVQFVASKNGKSYHLPTCPGAKNIAPENMVIFTSQAQAEQAGYTKAKNCTFPSNNETKN